MIKDMTLELSRKFTSAEYFLSNQSFKDDFFHYGMSWKEFREKCHYILKNFGISSPWHISQIGSASMVYKTPNDDRLYSLYCELGYKDSWDKKMGLKE